MADLADYFIDPERSALCALSFFAHELDRAIRNAVKLLEIVQPHRAILHVEKLCPKSHPGHGGAQIMTSSGDKPHPAFRHAGEDAVSVNRCRDTFQNREVARDAIGKPQRHADRSDGDKQNPAGESEQNVFLRMMMTQYRNCKPT